MFTRFKYNKKIKDMDIEIGSIVKYASGYYRVSAVRNSKKHGMRVNLKGVNSGTVYHKSVHIDEVVEASDEYYNNWRQSESYQCM